MFLMRLTACCVTCESSACEGWPVRLLGQAARSHAQAAPQTIGAHHRFRRANTARSTSTHTHTHTHVLRLPTSERRTRSDVSNSRQFHAIEKKNQGPFRKCGYSEVWTLGSVDTQKCGDSEV